MLEDLHIDAVNKDYNDLFFTAIKCFHNEFANNIKNNFIDTIN